jgi:DNA mismatch endonuclease (patch repair protein)
MSLIRSCGNHTTELRFVQILRKYKVTGWRRGQKLPGRPDFVFFKHRVAIFIDGDFWHGNPKKFRLPKSNCDYWEKKIRGNRLRDRRINKTLKSMDWQVIRFWESALKDEEAVMARLKLVL